MHVGNGFYSLSSGRIVRLADVAAARDLSGVPAYLGQEAEPSGDQPWLVRNAPAFIAVALSLVAISSVVATLATVKKAWK